MEREPRFETTAGGPPGEPAGGEPAGGVDAVVLAGSINRIPLYPGNRPGCKALVELGGRPLLAWVLDALCGARGTARILVVGPEPVRQYAARHPCNGHEIVPIPEGDSLIDNAWRGLDAARTPRVLFANPDQPLLRPEMVDDFLARALPVDADLVSSWVRLEDLGPYREGAHKFGQFRDGWYAHGNLFLARRAFPDAREARRRLDALYRARKSNLRFAWALGLELFLRFLLARITGRLPTLEETLRTAGEHFGVRLAGVVCPYPEILLDIDEPEDYAAAARYLAEGLPAARSLQGARPENPRLRAPAA